MKFVFMLHAMCDILEITSSLSRVFQKDNLLVTEVYFEVEAHILRLEALKHEHGPMMKVMNMLAYYLYFPLSS